MHLEIIESHARLAELKGDWEAVYAADPEAQFFLSWTWLSGWFQAIEKNWFVLAAKVSADSASFAGFFPLRWRRRVSRQGTPYTELAMGGSRLADYTGFICRPEVEREVARAFASHLEGMPWTVVTFDWLCMSERRARLFLGRFTGKSYEVRDREVVNPIDDTNLCVAPFVRLPASWDEYLEDRLSANSRQKARRFLRKLTAQQDLRITLATAATFERDIGVLSELWKARWESRKGEERTEAILHSFRRMLKHCLDAGTLLMPVLWQGSRPLGTLVLLIDRPRRALRFQVSGCDTSVQTPPPGFLLHAWCIRRAIAEGFEIYDFLRGNERYKYSFGAEERRVRCVEILSRRPARPRAARLVPVSTPVAARVPAAAPLPIAAAASRTGAPETRRMSPLAWELARSKALS